MNEKPRLLLLLDFGGTKLTVAVIAAAAAKSSNPAWLAHERRYSPPGADAQYDIDTMITLGRGLLAGQTPAAVGVSFGGPTDYAAGVVIRSHHVAGWENIPLQALLETTFDAPARIDNDANVAALGAWRFGAGRGLEHLLYITVSTGVGAGWILNGRSWRGVNSMAGEIGHMVVDPSGPLCLCGKHGCVERYASGPYMAQDAKLMLQQYPLRGQILRVMAQDTAVSGKLISQAAAAGDEIAQAILQRGAWALGVGIGNAANLVNPQRFILGGGVTKAGPLWWDVVQNAARATALSDTLFDIVPAQLGDDTPLWGAVALVEQL